MLCLACGLEAGAPTDGGVLADGGFPARGPVTISYTTVNLGGTFSPRNVGAAWVEDAAGTFVKTLDVWAFVRGVFLVEWNAASGGNRVDAVTGATASRFGPRVDTWDMTDVAGNAVPDGDYILKIEFTDQNKAGPVFEFPIHKGANTPDTTLPDQSFVIDVSVDYP